jgi:hypothetical protein
MDPEWLLKPHLLLFCTRYNAQIHSLRPTAVKTCWTVNFTPMQVHCSIVGCSKVLSLLSIILTALPAVPIWCLDPLPDGGRG